MEEKHWLSDLLGFLRLTREQEDNEIIHESIEKAIIFRGTNLWILIFAILIASVGLNMNSPAVIIGAMLISPLMGPINGLGYSIATYNIPLLRKSFKNFAFSAIAALVTSTLYFILTPIHTEHSELLARTSPTIFDVMIALFGGLAGIVAITSKNKGNVIPGVAIATALMPPLCTAGYGLSIGNFSYFFGALYLFTINSVFIAVSAMAVSQLLKLPKKAYLLSKEIKNKNIAVGVAIALTIVPSFFFGLSLVSKEKFKVKAEHFVQQVSLWEGNYLLKQSVNPDTREIKLVYGGNEFDEKTKSRLMDKAKDLNLGSAIITVHQGLKIKDFQDELQSSDEFTKMNRQINKLKATIIYREKSIDSLKSLPVMGESLLKEIKPLYPTINSCIYAPTAQYIDTLDKSIPVSIVYLNSTEPFEVEDETKIYNWLKNRLDVDTVYLKF
ncbi:MAG: DUF389 domain-containing protein [Crocinitomicaceae bacterium]|nr:DUF389 domain-containing protein [Crocinitomicaceae bacterium]